MQSNNLNTKQKYNVIIIFAYENLQQLKDKAYIFLFLTLLNERILMMIFMGKTKTTEVVEQERLQLWNDYQVYQKVENSDSLKTYLALKEKVDSKPFQENKKQIEMLRFKGSPEEKMIKELESLDKNSKLRRYFNVKDSNDLDRFKTIEKSGQLNRLKELEQQVNSARFKAETDAIKHQKKSKREINSDLEKSNVYAVMHEYENLKTSDEVHFYYRYKKTRAYRNYLAVEGSTLLSEFENLKKEVNSDKFNERKAYLEDKLRYEKTTDYKELVSFQKLDSNPEIRLYIKYHGTDSFRFFRNWQPTFSDDFDGQIDKSKWSFISPIAEKGPGRNFSMRSQLHYANLEDKFHLKDSILTLETTQHKVVGLFWDEQFGFIQKPFNYVSGLVHTLNYFKQEYGHFEIKLKASRVKGVISSVSLVDESEEFCIRLFTSNGGKIQGGLLTTDHLNKTFTPVSLSFPSKGYVIVTLSWTPEKLEWRINEKHAGTITHNIPRVPLGIRIETEVIKETGNLPHRLDIDWIKCYKRIN